MESENKLLTFLRQPEVFKQNYGKIHNIMNLITNESKSRSEIKFNDFGSTSIKLYNYSYQN